MKNSKKNNKQKIYLLKGGADSWNAWFKENGATQGPYNSLGIEGIFSSMGNFFSGWGQYFIKLALRYSPYKYIYDMIISITPIVTTTILNSLNSNKVLVKQFLDFLKTPSIKEVPKMGDKS
jgi:hypothetical protein